MKILIITTKLPYPPRDGGAIATLNMATGLADAGNNVVMLAMNTAKHYYPPEKIPGSLRQKIKIIAVDVNTRIRWFKFLGNLLFSSLPYNATRFYSEVVSAELKKILIDDHFDIVQLEGPYLDRYVPLIRQFTNASIAFRSHNLEHMIWSGRAESARNPVMKMYLSTLSHRIRRLESRLLGNIDFLIPISGKDLEGFIELGLNKPSMVCPTGLNMVNYSTTEEQGEFDLFFIGALDWGPNTEGLDWFFDQVWPGIVNRSDGIKLHIAGRNSELYFRKRDIPSNIVNHGEVDDSIGFMNDYSVMIVPLLSGSGIRIKILEGMAMKKVVITTSKGAEGIPVTHNENIIIADSPQDFSEAVISLKEDISLIRKIGENAFKLITENFDNLVISENLTTFYKERLK